MPAPLFVPTAEQPASQAQEQQNESPESFHSDTMYASLQRDIATGQIPIALVRKLGLERLLTQPPESLGCVWSPHQPKRYPELQPGYDLIGIVDANAVSVYC